VLFDTEKENCLWELQCILDPHLLVVRPN